MKGLWRRGLAWWRGLGQGLYNGLSALLGKEMRGRTRGWRSVFLLSVYLGVLGVGMAGFLWLSLGQGSFVNPQVGLSLYGFFVLALVMLLAFIAPATSAGAISGERERRTYDLLLVTNASPAGIVLGKWLASVLYLLFLVVASLPTLALVFLFGGVPLANLALALLLAVLTGLGYGALGLAFSAVIRRTQTATISAVVVVFMLIFVTLGVAVITIATGRSQANIPYPDPGGGFYTPPAPPWYVYASPLVALQGVLPGDNLNFSPGIPLVGSILNELLRPLQLGTQSGYSEYAYKMGYAYGPAGYNTLLPNTPVVSGLAGWPPWARFALYQALLTLFCLSAAVLAITPVKPWTAWRARLRRPGRSPGVELSG